MPVESAQAGVLGLDFNADGQQMTPKLARAFRDAGYRFCVRYVPREATAKTLKIDLSRDEARMLLDEGFAVMAVQHFERAAGWVPDPEKGRRYGAFAAEWAREKVGLPDGVCIFLDLEAVKSGTPKDDIVGYCSRWYDEVEAAGYAPGIYLGDQARLTDEDVRKRLKFEHYWIAFNEVRHLPLHLKQIWIPSHPELRPKGAEGFRFQADRTSVDPQGGSVRWLAPG
jgi:Domain of unknown function (DUF1906)